MKYCIIIVVAVFLITFPTKSYAKCKVEDKLCLMAEINKIAEKIDDKSWHDTTLRELAKSYTYDGHEDKAVALIDDIQTPDTKAMTIRGIGMAAADNKWKTAEGYRDKERYAKLFEKLKEKAETIEHKPSYAIAYTYIAMSQAFAKDDAGAMATAKSMDNAALRHKAFGETAEIQAERGDYEAAMASIKEIESNSFRNKAYGTVARIFIKRNRLQEAYNTAQNIDNDFARAQILQNIVNSGNPEEDINAKKKSQ